MSQIINNALHHTESVVQGNERTMVSLLTNRDVKEFMDLPRDAEPYDAYRLRGKIREYGIAPLFIRNPEVMTVYLINFDGQSVYFFNGGPEVSPTAEESAERLRTLRQRTNADGRLTLLNDSIIPGQETHRITLARQIRGLTSPERKGLLVIEMMSQELSALWKGIDLGKEGYFFIVDESRDIVYHPDAGRIRTKMDAAWFQSLLRNRNGLFMSEEESVERVYMNRASTDTGWNLVASMPRDQLRKPIANIRSNTIAVGIATLALASWIAYRFGRSITRPIARLKRGMRQTEQGNWHTIPPPHPKDEIGELIERYNVMVTRLSELVTQVYQAEVTQRDLLMERQKAELQSLQLQINPHFLYNTLETIVCYAAIEDSEEISEIVKCMAYMLRYSVQTDLEEITVANELKHVMNYMVILQHRIGRDFEVDVAIRPELLLRHMVRLTLQPWWRMCSSTPSLTAWRKATASASMRARMAASSGSASRTTASALRRSG